MNRLAGFPSYWRFVDLINQQIALLMNIFWPKSHACCMSVVLLGILFFGSQIGWICAVSTCNPCPRSPDENPEFSTSSSHSKAISKCWSHLFVSQLSLSKFHDRQIPRYQPIKFAVVWQLDYPLLCWNRLLWIPSSRCAGALPHS